MVGCVPVPPSQQPRAAAEGVADRADAGAGSVERGQPVRGRLGEHMPPAGSGGDPGGPAHRVDRYLGHPLCGDEHGVFARRHRGPVPGRQHADRAAVRGGGTDRCGHIVGAYRAHDEGGTVLGGEIQPGALGVVIGIVRPEHRT